ncbi:MAG: asparaginase [Bdellovibrionales bacterium]|nr:asparaginase [Oligoflexia bacterium]
MKKRRILVIYTGGTFGMDETLKIPKLSPQALRKRLLTQVPEMSRMVDCDVQIVFNTDSCQMNSGHWFELAAHLKAHQDNYDGAVILHGTDTLAYSAAALSLLLGANPIPVVITGAQKPLAMLRNDARSNFISALEVAAFAPKELQNRVMVVFHDELFLGSRVRKKSALSFSAFESPRFPRLAQIGSTIQYEGILKNLPKLKSSTFSNPLGHSKAYSSRILSAEITPEFPSSLFSTALLQEVDGIILTLYTSGTAPTGNAEFVQFLERAKANCVPIYAITEREDAPAELSNYQAGKELLNEGVLWCRDLTPEAAFVKSWLLRAGRPKNESKEKYFSWLKKNWEKAISDETS